MTSSKISGFWTPSLPLSVPNSRNLPSFGQKLGNPLPSPQCRRHMYIAFYLNAKVARRLSLQRPDSGDVE